MMIVQIPDPIFPVCKQNSTVVWMIWSLVVKNIFTVYSRPFLPFSLYVVELQVVRLPFRHKHIFVSSRRVSGSSRQSTAYDKKGGGEGRGLPGKSKVEIRRPTSSHRRCRILRNSLERRIM